jgi:hypothetical protein
VTADNIVDETTANWPIPPDMSDDMCNLMHTHMALPLPVYKGNSYIDPVRVNAAIKGALVKVHFCLHHYRIKQKEGNRSIDWFAGIVQQIVILKDGVPKTDSSYYKHKNLLDGPYRLKPFDSPSLSAIPSEIVSNKSPAGTSPPLPTQSTERMSVPKAVETTLVASGSKVLDEQLPVLAVHHNINIVTADTHFSVLHLLLTGQPG